MAQSPITETGPLDAPTIYTVPGSGPITPLSIYAEIDATSAAQSFLGTLLIRSQSGAPLAYIPLPSEIAPGDYVEATWAPFLRTSSASTNPLAVLPYAYVRYGADTVNAGDTNFTFATMDLITDAASIFSVQSVAGKQGLNINTQGHYLSMTTAICLTLGSTQTAHMGVKSALIPKGDFLYGTADFTIYGKCSFTELYEVPPSQLSNVIVGSITNQTATNNLVELLRVVIQLDTIDPTGDIF